MLFLLSLIVRALAGLLVGGRSDDGTRDLEILVLRHQLRVLRRKVGRPKLKPTDRMLLSVTSRFLPRVRWASFMLPRRRSFAGTVSWCGGSGPTDTIGSQDDLRSIPRPST
jgi:hypothetical protein